ncbi:DUF4391 domain-containing protein [Methanogenium sp. S4BF]|uniref:DUF4391 domain-containing protein n=1 Tax=Methanogenium sp. S4BF TaxID=1789226 RepID=UPI002415A5D7|nr:DUF4391 domain-containing protein [Methanogenium sp. S4BF]WFN33464.1 DUF4391 domain-containing protein [Methanogenium sp. S4BF]
MLDLPVGTKYQKRIPKTKFYQHLSLSPKVKQQFVDEIDTIFWQNKLSPDTLGIAAGKEVQEIEVFEIKLRQFGISKNLLEIMDRQIPYHIVFVLTFDGMAQIVIGYKEKSKKKDDTYKVEKYVYSEWCSPDECAQELKGLNLDGIYENLLREYLPEEQPQLKDLRETIALQKEIEKQTALCAALENKMKKERQFNKQVHLNQELREQKAKLEGMLSEQISNCNE